MDGKNDPLAAILAEMRDDRIIRLDGANVTRCLLHNLADRIEAAAERELDEARKARDEARETAEDALWELAELRERAPGNAAALREALERSLAIFQHIGKCASKEEVSRKKLAFVCEDMSAKIEAALAAPARNCDTNMKDASARWNGYKMSAPCPPGGWDEGDLFDWLFATAEGGAK